MNIRSTCTNRSQLIVQSSQHSSRGNTPPVLKSQNPRKRPLSKVATSPAHNTFIPKPPYPIVPSNASSHRRASIASSDTISSYAGTTFKQEHGSSRDGEHTWDEQAVEQYLVHPRIEPHSDPMASAMTSYINFAVSELSRGVPTKDVFGPDRAIVDLLFRRRKPTDAHSVCHFTAELCAGLSGIEMPAKLGISFMYTYFIRVSVNMRSMLPLDALPVRIANQTNT